MLVAAVCLSALSLCATENADAKETFFIVYQSGGKITPFLDTEIDSIGFSKFDTDSVEHPQWHSQVVYTPDSAYVFPLAQVDSVGFQALPTIYKPQVIHMTSAYYHFRLGNFLCMEAQERGCPILQRIHGTLPLRLFRESGGYDL